MVLLKLERQACKCIPGTVKVSCLHSISGDERKMNRIIKQRDCGCVLSVTSAPEIRLMLVSSVTNWHFWCANFRCYLSKYSNSIKKKLTASLLQSSVTWSFRNLSNKLIYCSGNLICCYYYYHRYNLCCLIFLWLFESLKDQHELEFYL